LPLPKINYGKSKLSGRIEGQKFFYLINFLGAVMTQEQFPEGTWGKIKQKLIDSKQQWAKEKD